jgi:hypothetical protein
VLDSILPDLPTSGNAGSLLDFALQYAARGWNVIPLAGKKPAVKWKRLQGKEPQEDIVRGMFRQPGVTGIGHILRPGIGLRDFDEPGSYKAWAAANPGDASVLPTVATRRGHHVYGSLDSEKYIRFGDGELIGNCRHQVILPPSRHPSGAVYSWLQPLPPRGQPLPALPESLFRQWGVASEDNTSNTRDTTTQDTACVSCVANDVQAIIARTLPGAIHQRNGAVFSFARALRGILPADTARNTLRECAREWHSQGVAKGFIGTRDFTSTWIDFATAWDAIRSPEGSTFAAIVATAKAMPTPATALAFYDAPTMHMLVQLCAALQKFHGVGNPWPLSCRLAAEHIGIDDDHKAAAKMLKTLVFDGLLELVKIGTIKGRRASEYRYITPEHKE